MANPTLVEYIKKQYTRGASLESIVQELLEKWWSKNEIKEAAIAAGGQAVPTPPAPPAPAAPTQPSLPAQMAAPSGGGHGKLIALIVVLALLCVGALILIFGPFHPFSYGDPYQKYSSLSSKFDSMNNVRLGYTMTISMFALGNMNANMEVEKLNGGTKSVATSSYMGYTTTSIAYKKGDKTITCSTTSNLSSGISGMSCGLSYSNSSQSILTSPFATTENDKLMDKNKFDISITGEKSFVGRTCTNFIIKPLNNTFFNLSSAASGGSSIFVEQCLDNEFGFTSYLAVWVDAATDVQTKMLSLELKYFARNVTEEEMMIPVPFQISANCIGSNVNLKVTAFNDLSSMSTILNLSNIWDKPIKIPVQLDAMSFGEEKTMTIPTGKELTNSYTVELCTNDYCAKDYCYSYTSYNSYSFKVNKVYNLGTGCDSMDIKNTGSRTMLAGTSFEIKDLYLNSLSPRRYIKLGQNLLPGETKKVMITAEGSTTVSSIPVGSYVLRPSATESNVSVSGYSSTYFTC